MAEHNGLSLTWLDFNVVAGALERLLEFKLVELGVVDVFSIPGLVVIVDDVFGGGASSSFAGAAVLGFMFALCEWIK